MVAASEDIPIILPVQKTIIEQIVIKPSLTASGVTRVNTAKRKDLDQDQDNEINLGSP